MGHVKTLTGADTEALRALASSLDGASSELDDIRVAATKRIVAFDWIGRDKDAFEGDWQARLAPAVKEAAAAVRQASKAITKQADQQDKASAGGSAATAASAGGKGAPKTQGPVVELSTKKAGDKEALNNPPPSSHIVVDGKYHYWTDDQGRVVKAQTTLNKVDHDNPRDEKAQRNLRDKLKGDDAGHIFARMFGGPGQAVNLTPMERYTVNQGSGTYGQLEKMWQKAIESGKAIELEVTLQHDDADFRPEYIGVRYTIDGKPEDVLIKNIKPKAK